MLSEDLSTPPELYPFLGIFDVREAARLLESEGSPELAARAMGLAEDEFCLCFESISGVRPHAYIMHLKDAFDLSLAKGLFDKYDSPDTVARKMGISRAILIERFKGVAGMTTTEYVNERYSAMFDPDTAREHLREQENIEAAARDMGLDGRRFVSLFRSSTGKHPGDYLMGLYEERFDPEKATELLDNGVRPKEIAAQMNIPFYCLRRCFRESTGWSLSRYLAYVTGPGSIFLDTVTAAAIFGIDGGFGEAVRKMGIDGVRVFEYDGRDTSGIGGKVMVGSVNSNGRTALISINNLEKYSYLYGICNADGDPGWKDVIDGSMKMKEHREILGGTEFRSPIYPIKWWEDSELEFLLNEISTALGREIESSNGEMISGSGRWGNKNVTRTGEDMLFIFKRLSYKVDHLYRISGLRIATTDRGLEELRKTMERTAETSESQDLGPVPGDDTDGLISDDFEIDYYGETG
jgi:AraC-like DNA-binding protein